MLNSNQSQTHLLILAPQALPDSWTSRVSDSILVRGVGGPC